MKKLCFGSYIAVLVWCEAEMYNQKQLIGGMLHSINENYDISDDDGATAALAWGKNNLSSDVTLYLDEVEDKLPAKFAESVLPMLNPNKKKTIVLAFKDILRDDADIADDTEVELLNHLTKKEILERDSFVFADLLAGMFLYVARYTNNHDVHEYVKEITVEYIHEIDSHRDIISFIPSYSIERIDQIRGVTQDAHIMSMMAQQEGTCLMCGKPLIAGSCTSVRLTDNSEALLCLECGASVSHSDDKMAEAMEIRENLLVRYKVNEAISEDKLIPQVRELLEQLQKISTEDVELHYTPLTIDKKVYDRLLARKVRGYIMDGMYEAVNTCIESLAAESRMNVRNLSKCIRRAFEDAYDETKQQSAIFNALTDFVFTKTGQKHREASELLVAYFVQRCEVFNEIAE